jgi:hypothetical protein
VKVYVVSQGNTDFHRVEAAKDDWNKAVKFAVEELSAEDEIRENKKDRDGQTVWESWSDDTLTRITQLDIE